jgi:RNA polymerase sigma factor (TIGR02999 family)
VAGAEKLLPLVYDELRRLAAHKLSKEKPGQTLQATALVHEAYLRLAGNNQGQWSGRSHFYNAAAEAMRRILVDHARAKGRQKRGGGERRRLSLSVVELAAAADSEEILATEEAVRRLEGQDPTAAQVVKLRFYAGLSVEDTAAAMGVSERTVMREWSYARAWLFRQLEG